MAMTACVARFSLGLETILTSPWLFRSIPYAKILQPLGADSDEAGHAFQ
jgi:hypothetical protein